MRRVEQSRNVRLRLRAVWTAVATLECWSRAFSALIGFPVECTVIQGDISPPGPDTRLALTKPNGKRIAEVKITDWSPLKGVEFSAVSPGWLTGLTVLTWIRLSEIDDEMTEVSFGAVILCRNPLIEIMGLMMPTGLMYGGRLRRGLDSVEDLAR